MLSPDGALLAMGWNSNLVLWDVVRKQQLASLVQHTALLRAVAFSSDGSLLATGAQDNTVVVWDVATRAPVALLAGECV